MVRLLKKGLLFGCLIAVSVIYGLAWGEDAIRIPEGTLGPVTLKTSLSKTENLPLTLEQALQLVEGKNIDIELEKENLRQSRLNTILQISDFLPDLVTEYRQSRFVGGSQIFGGELVRVTRTTYQPQLTATYEVYSGGKNIFQVRSSLYRQEAQLNLTEDTRQNILKEVAIAYYDLQKDYWQRAIALQAIKEAELRVELNQSRLDNGIGIKLDLLQAKTFLSSREQDLLQAENLIVKASDHIAQLLNLDFQTDIVPYSLESTVVKLIGDDISFKDLITTAKLYNPRLKTLSELLNAAKSDVRVAIADIFPKFDVTAYINGTGKDINELTRTYFAGLHVGMELLENLGFEKPIKIKQAKSNVRLAELTLAQAGRQLEENLANSVADAKTFENKIQIAKEALGYAQTAYSQAFGRLREGVGTNVELEDAMTSLIEARSDLASSFLDYNKAQVSLLSNLGVVSVSTLTEGYKPNVASISTP